MTDRFDERFYCRDGRYRTAVEFATGAPGLSGECVQYLRDLHMRLADERYTVYLVEKLPRGDRKLAQQRLRTAHVTRLAGRRDSLAAFRRRSRLFHEGIA